MLRPDDVFPALESFTETMLTCVLHSRSVHMMNWPAPAQTIHQHLAHEMKNKTKKTRDLFFNAPLTRIPSKPFLLLSVTTEEWWSLTFLNTVQHCISVYNQVISNCFQICKNEQIQSHTLGVSSEIVLRVKARSKKKFSWNTQKYIQSFVLLARVITCIYYTYRSNGHFISCILLISAWTAFCLQNRL